MTTEQQIAFMALVCLTLGLVWTVVELMVKVISLQRRLDELANDCIKGWEVMNANSAELRNVIENQNVMLDALKTELSLNIIIENSESPEGTVEREPKRG